MPTREAESKSKDGLIQDLTQETPTLEMLKDGSIQDQTLEAQPQALKLEEK
jgi:hypothetical protein